MPEPLRGLVAIAEYGSKLEVDMAVAALTDNGIEAIPSYDPAAVSLASFAATDRTFELLVREADADVAVAVLESFDEGLPPEFTEPLPRSRRRARVRRLALIAFLLWFGIPILIVLAMEIAHR